MIRERAIKLGKSAPLVGILSEPPPEAESAGRPGVLLLNSGILHRVGACRLHVRLARRLAQHGYTVVRFDFSGIGDSAVRKDDLGFEESAIVEIRETMDQLQRMRGIETFVPMGLCSGADMAFEVAKVDERVIGVGLLDLWAYRTPGYYLRRYGPKLLSLPTWINSIKVRLAERREKAEEEQAPDTSICRPTSVSTRRRRRPPGISRRSRLGACASVRSSRTGSPRTTTTRGSFARASAP